MLRLLHACGMPMDDVDFFNAAQGHSMHALLLEAQPRMTLFTGSSKVAMATAPRGRLAGLLVSLFFLSTFHGFPYTTLAYFTCRCFSCERFGVCAPVLIYFSLCTKLGRGAPGAGPARPGQAGRRRVRLENFGPRRGRRGVRGVAVRPRRVRVFRPKVQRPGVGLARRGV